MQIQRRGQSKCKYDTTDAVGSARRPISFNVLYKKRRAEIEGRSARVLTTLSHHSLNNEITLGDYVGDYVDLDYSCGLKADVTALPCGNSWR